MVRVDSGDLAASDSATDILLESTVAEGGWFCCCEQDGSDVAMLAGSHALSQLLRVVLLPWTLSPGDPEA